MNETPTFSVADALVRLSERADLSREESRRVMGELLAGDVPPAAIGALLMGLRVKGETIEEITGLVVGMRAAAMPVALSDERTLDIVGTGGDGSGSFNISTASALVVAGAGVPVAKHGNRSASSLCGSADVLEALGVPIDLDAAAVSRSLEEHGFAFLFARTFHPAMRHVAGPRRDLRTRTVFNILGPMTHPGGVRRQLLGVYEDGLRDVCARVLQNLGSDAVWVVHGDGGIDEVSTSGPTRVTAIEGDRRREFELTPEDAGLPRHPAESLRGGDAGSNARIIEGVLDGRQGAPRDAVLLNAAAALAAAGEARDLREGCRRAAESIDSGAARSLLERLRSGR